MVSTEAIRRGIEKTTDCCAAKDVPNRYFAHVNLAFHFDFPVERPGSKLAAGRAHSVESLHSRLEDSRARDAELRRHSHEVGKGVGLHLLHYFATVRLHCDLADAELSTNLFIQ